MKNPLAPTKDQLQKLKSLPMDQSVAVLNLFKFNKKAQYHIDDAEYGMELSGLEAWEKYSMVAGKHIKDLGGRVAFSAPASQTLIGPEDDWDLAAIMYFPSRKAFISMLTNPAFQKTSRHRKAALAKHTQIHLDGASF